MANIAFCESWWSPTAGVIAARYRTSVPPADYRWWYSSPPGHLAHTEACFEEGDNSGAGRRVPVMAAGLISASWWCCRHFLSSRWKCQG